MNRNFDTERTAIFAEEAAVVEVQSLLHQLMQKKGWSRADLARAMNVTRARVTQIFSDECKNLTVRLLVRAMTALGEEFTISVKSDAPAWLGVLLEEGRARDRCTDASKGWLEVEDLQFSGKQTIANDNFFSGLAALRQIREETYELAA